MPNPSRSRSKRADAKWPTGAPPVVLGFLLAAAALSWGCSPPAPPPIDVQFGGCYRTLFPGPICMLDVDRKLTLWTPTVPDSRVEVRVDGRRFENPGEPVLEGLRFALTLPAGARHVEIFVTNPRGETSRRSLAVIENRPLKPGERDVQEEVRAGSDSFYDLIQALDFRRARENLENREALEREAELPAVAHYFLRYDAALLADKEGDIRRALDELDRTIAIVERAGDPSSLWYPRQKRATVLAYLGRSREAAEIFSELANSLPSDPCEKGKFFNNWAWTTLLAREVGGGRDIGEPASPVDPGALLGRAIETYAAGSCKATDVLNSRLNRVLAHLQEGRVDLAARARDAARSTKTSGTLFQELWALDLEARIDLARGVPKAAFETYGKLDRIAQAVGSADGRLRAALGLARSSARLGDREGALAILADAERLLDGRSLEVPLDEGRLTFVSQREGVASLEIELLLDAGRTGDALSAARRARSRVLRQLDLSERLASLPPAERKRWSDEITSYTKTRNEIDLSVHGDWGRLAGELVGEQAARTAMARKASGQLDGALKILGPPPGDNVLAPIAAGELLLAFHPLPRAPGARAEWVVFSASTDRLDFRKFSLGDAPDDETALARAILAPFRTEIEGALKIRILPYGALRDVDFHALPFEGDVLLAKKPVVYGLDIKPAAGSPRRAERSEEGPPKALIVADPGRNLPGTVAEADAVLREIRTWTPRWRVERLDGARAKIESVKSRLPGLDLLHFAGHGRFFGVGGSDSALLLADDQRLNVGQIVVLDGAPRFVVLSGCETGSAGPESRVEGLGLANAFVLAGSRAVVASVRVVDDRSAEPLLTDLYRRWRGGEDLALALQQALLAWRKSNPDRDWRSFRLIEP